MADNQDRYHAVAASTIPDKNATNNDTAGGVAIGGPNGVPKNNK